jgi:hypothetical protein
MMAYSKIFNTALNLIIAVAFFLAFKKIASIKGKFVLLTTAVLVFVLPEIFRTVPFDGTWTAFYILKIGFGIFCLLYVRFKRK